MNTQIHRYVAFKYLNTPLQRSLKTLFEAEIEQEDLLLHFFATIENDERSLQVVVVPEFEPGQIYFERLP